MPSRRISLPAAIRGRGVRVYLRPPRRADAAVFLAAVRSSRRLHAGFVHPPTTPGRFASLVARYSPARRVSMAEVSHVGLLVLRRTDDALVGIFNVSEIVRGAFKSAYLGYYGFASHAGQGYMQEGMRLVLAFAFRTLRLHRIEANIQPRNRRSIALAERCGFTREGYSRRYVRIAGRWRDHVRYAMLVEDWRAARARAK